MTLTKLYKQKIKTLSANLKLAKPASRKLQSCWSKGLADSPEADAARQVLYSFNSIHSMKTEVRYLLLAYAVIRGKDLSKVETNPREAHNPEQLQKTIHKIELEFAALTVEA